jgi:hypothetical protein
MIKAFGSTPKMAATNIVKCPKCANLQLATQKQKTKTCTYCGAKINLQKAQRVASAPNAFAASEMIKKLKEPKP